MFRGKSTKPKEITPKEIKSSKRLIDKVGRKIDRERTKFEREQEEIAKAPVPKGIYLFDILIFLLENEQKLKPGDWNHDGIVDWRDGWAWRDRKS